MENNNKEVAQGGVESAAFLLRAGRLSGEVDDAARAWYEQVKGTRNPASAGMKAVLSNPLNKEIHEQIETNESNTFSSSGENKSEEEEASKVQEDREINTNSWSSNDKTKSGEYCTFQNNL